MANSVSELKQFFSTPEKEVKAKEMMDFWKSLSPEEKEYYENATLS